MGCVIPFPRRFPSPPDGDVSEGSRDKLRSVLDAMTRDTADLSAGLHRALGVAASSSDLSGVLPRLYGLLDRVDLMGASVQDLRRRMADCDLRIAAVAVIELVLQVDKLQQDTTAIFLEALTLTRALN